MNYNVIKTKAHCYKTLFLILPQKISPNSVSNVLYMGILE